MVLLATMRNVKFQPINAKNKHYFLNSEHQQKEPIKKPTKKPPKNALTKENQTSENQQKNHKKSQTNKIIHKFLLLIFNHLQK